MKIRNCLYFICLISCSTYVSLRHVKNDFELVLVYWFRISVVAAYNSENNKDNTFEIEHKLIHSFDAVYNNPKEPQYRYQNRGHTNNFQGSVTWRSIHPRTQNGSVRQTSWSIFIVRKRNFPKAMETYYIDFNPFLYNVPFLCLYKEKKMFFKVSFSMTVVS